MIRLSGLEPGRDIEVVFTGLRPGEKLYEELFAEGEDYARTRHEKVFVCRNGVGSEMANGKPVLSSGEGSQIAEGVDALIAAAQREDRTAILEGLRRLVPEFRG